MPIRQTLTPAQVSDLCEGLLDPSRSLIDIARRFGCSVVTLLELFYEPEITLRLKTAEAVARERARLLITNSLANAVHVLSRMLDNEGQAERTMPDTSKTHILALRSRDGARRAASLLLQIGRARPAHICQSARRPGTPHRPRSG